MKNRIARSIICLLMAMTTVLAMGLLNVTAYAKTETCGYHGCTASTKNCSNGTVYCDTHAAQYAREKGYKVCGASGCYASASSNGTYCSGHTCSSRKCNKFTKVKGKYCTEHTCKYSGCTDSAYYTSGTYKGYCSKHAGKNNSSYSKKKKYTMPDCDDYEDYDDFMDEWDGYMPDGSDAEDYWDNW